MNMSSDSAAKLAFVTGGSRGLGFEVARGLARTGIGPLSAINSGIEILDEKQRDKYLDLLSGNKIFNQDHLSNSINLILNSSITGSKISETLRLNLETFQRSHRNEVLKAIKKSEVWLLGPLGLCAFMSIRANLRRKFL